MDRPLLQEIIACLPRGRTLFHYFKDRYALLLLARAAARSDSIAALKSGGYGRLFDKAVVREALAAAGGGRATPALFGEHWRGQVEPFVLTLGCWGGRGERWRQTSRDGYNLVLQLNFSEHHGERYRRLVRPRGTPNGFGHPVLRRRADGFYRDTLAWCRIDVDFARDEALIEEVQSDWLRVARGGLKQLERGLRPYWCGENGELRRYVEEVLAPYAKLWDEAMLAAALEFIGGELGIKDVYYHDFDTGNALKDLRDAGFQPPRSLYRELPQRFCFQRRRAAPSFLYQDRRARRVLKKLDDARFFYQRL